MTKTVLITGGAGFIGHRVTNQLLDLGYTPRLFDNLYRPDDKATDLISDPRVEFVQGDVRHLHRIDEAMDGVTDVIHLAATNINKSQVDTTEGFEVNLMGSENTFRSAVRHGVRRIVFASSASVYGEPESLPMDENSPRNPVTPYCISKDASERLLEFYAKKYPIEWNALRFFNVYGPGQNIDAYYTSVIQVFIKRIIDGDAPMIDGDGSQTMDFVHVDDIANSLVLALESEQHGHICNIGTGTETSVADLARILLKALDSDLEPQFSPRDVLVTRRRADWSKAEKILGWKPTILVEDGIADLARRLADDYRAGRST